MERRLNNLAADIHIVNRDKGFYDRPFNIGEKLMLITSELGECLDADRAKKYANLIEFQIRLKQLTDSINRNISTDERVTILSNSFISAFQTHIKDTVEDEIADTIIRILDLCGYLKIDIESHIELKLKYNTKRAHKHGKEY